jgi:hypothetical protein
MITVLRHTFAPMRPMLFAVFVSWACGIAPAQELDLPDVFSAEPLNTAVANTVVARVGPTSITAREFFCSYIFGPSFVKKRPDSRRRHLDFMVHEKLLALGEEAKTKVRDPRIVENLRAVEGDVATEELYRDDVLSRVRVTEQEIDSGVQRQNVEVTMRWLYAGDKQDAEASSRALQKGASFDSLFLMQFADSTLQRDDRTMRTTMFELVRRNSAMARIAEDLPVARPSDPVHGPDGWYIVRIDSLWRNVIITGSADADTRLSVRRAVSKMKADSISDAYIRKMMLNADAVIQRRTFDILRAHLGEKVLSPETVKAWDLDGGFRAELKQVDYINVEQYGGEALVTLRSGKITLGEFLRWYRVREPNLKLRLTSPQAFFLSLEDLVWRMVRDELLVERARNRGLQNRPGVVTQVRWWKDKLVYQVAKDSLRRTISWTDSTLRAYHTAHPRSFRDSTGTVLQFDAVRDDVLREWYAVTLSERIVRRLAELRRQYPVTVDEDNLKRIPADAENDPRAIDVVVAKKGGTFPRPAFPTIDPFWQTWQ